MSIALIVTILASPASFAKIIESHSIALNFSLKDQNDKLLELSKLRGKIIVITASGRKGADDNKVWGEAIGKEYGDKLFYFGAADLRGVPPIFRWFALQITQKTAPPGISVLLDWEGKIFKAYDLVPEVSNVIVIDKYGKIRAKEAGKCSKESLQRLFIVLDKIMGEGN
ncbi:MAG: hypothetical protein FD145_1367 [Candidatus Saganbacteria bacterium]|uniref:Redoxin domain-containing protein n=1 Tax=Candidatus Saganbacteria bacterium TaxID=2575572 RepID=A0A833L027_UNCSA|nr:MAG: hypothetical protein FD145_1367 [Candidatus Saganbacteria bacterium]